MIDQESAFSYTKHGNGPFLHHLMLVEIIVVKIGGLVLPDYSCFADLLLRLEDLVLVDKTCLSQFLHVEVHVRIVRS